MDRIGRYQIVRELGRGGQGAVYEGIDPELGRRVAIKLLGEIDPELLLRFQREGELLATLDHPNVVRVHELGRAEQGPYLVTDLVEGTGLRQVRELTPRRAAEIVRDLADAVAAVHAQGIVHRDLKPENVILREDGQVMLLDFGIARGAEKERLTETGTMMGTPNYMAPEQTMDSHGVDERADVYGLGGVLYTLLTDEVPFRGPNLAAVLLAVQNDSPARPSSVRSDIDPSLEEICLRALAKRREDRYPRAEDLRDALDGFLRGERSGAMPRAWLAGAALLVALMVLAAVLWPRPEESTTARPKPPRPAEDLAVVARDCFAAGDWQAAADSASEAMKGNAHPELRQLRLRAWLALGHLERVMEEAAGGSPEWHAARVDRAAAGLASRTREYWVERVGVAYDRARHEARLQALNKVIADAKYRYPPLGSVGAVLTNRLVGTLFGLAEELRFHPRALRNDDRLVVQLIDKAATLSTPSAPPTMTVLRLWIDHFRDPPGLRGRVRAARALGPALVPRARFVLRALLFLRAGDRPEPAIELGGHAKARFELEQLRWVHLGVVERATSAAWPLRGKPGWRPLVERGIEHAQAALAVAKREQRGVTQSLHFLALAYLNAGRSAEARACLPTKKDVSRRKSGFTELLRAECDVAEGLVFQAIRRLDRLVEAGVLHTKEREARLLRAVLRFAIREFKAAQADLAAAEKSARYFNPTAYPWRTLPVTKQAFARKDVRHLSANPEGIPAWKKD